MRESSKQAPDAPFDRDVASWGARLIAAGSILTLLYELAFLYLDRRFLSLSNWRIIALHAVPIGLYAVASVTALKVGPWMREHWQPIALSFSSAMIVCSASICAMTKEVEPFFVALVLFLAGTGPFLCWGERYQTSLSLIGISAFVIGTRDLSAPVGPYQWLGLLIAVAIGLFSTAFEKRLRRAYRHARDELLRSQERLIAQEPLHIAGELTSGIAHDVNNALHDIGLRLMLLGETANTREEYLAGVERIQRSVADAYRIVARVRELTTLQASEFNETADIEQIIRDAIDMARSRVAIDSLLNSRPIRFEQHNLGRLPRVKGSAAELRQVMLNLLLNARDAMTTGGLIEVESETEQNSVVVHITDEGSGIPAENLDRIFEPFFSTKGANGTGLGLSVSKSTVDKLGGNLSAANRPSGGAVFTVRLPAVDSA